MTPKHHTNAAVQQMPARKGPPSLLHRVLLSCNLCGLVLWLWGYEVQQRLAPLLSCNGPAACISIRWWSARCGWLPACPLCQ